MPLKKSKGNMYPWVSHTHTHLGGECPHRCSYCYVDDPRFGRPARYQGPLRLIEDEFKVKYDEKTLTKNGGTYPGTIFINHCNDLFAEEVPGDLVLRILTHCSLWPENTYVFQTKNPGRYSKFIDFLPANRILGCTIETNRPILDISKAPSPVSRAYHMNRLRGERRFVTIEPVMDFDVDVLAGWIADINPEFLNLGADSKGHSMPEPTVEKIHALVGKLKEYGIELREKHNLERLMR